jgi:hypothetical protein
MAPLLPLFSRVRAVAEPTTPAEGLWDAKQTRAFLKVSERTWRRLRGIPRVLLPGIGERPIVRYDPAEVRAWVRSRQSHSVLHPRDARDAGTLRRVG